MLRNPYFSHDGLKKANALVGTMLNDIVIERDDGSGGVRTVKVPVTYGPREQYLARTEGDPDLDKKVALQLPRIGFQRTGFQYDGQRKLNSLNRYTQKSQSGDKTVYDTVWGFVPWNIDYEVEVIAERAGDADKIIEQILPFFTPAWVPSAYLVESFPDLSVDLPIYMGAVSGEDTYDEAFGKRRIVTYRFGLTVKWLFFGPVSEKKVIKFARVNFHTSTDLTSPTAEYVTVQPGLTANGEPTYDPDESIPYADIEEDSNWAYIVRIESE